MTTTGVLAKRPDGGQGVRPRSSSTSLVRSAQQACEHCGAGSTRRTGDKLGRFTNRHIGRFTNRHIGGFDLCWRAPKSVSLLFAFGSPEISRAVRDAHDSAVAAAFGYLEDHAAWTRTGRGGHRCEPVDGLVAAMFRHRTSRAGDPHLHTHVLVANTAKGADGNWRILDGRQLYQHALTSGYLYQAQLRHELTTRLGVEWEDVDKGTADLVGIDRQVLREFSERRRQIEEHLDELGYRTARAAQIATFDTRPDKTTPDDDRSIAELWRAKATDIGFDPASLHDVVRRRARTLVTPDDVETLFETLAGPDGLTHHTSTFDRRDVLRGVAAGLPDGAPIADIESLADRFLDRPEIVALGHGNDITRSVRYSTAELLTLEEELVDVAIKRVDEHTGVVAELVVIEVLGERASLSAEQATMVRRLCCDGDGLAVVAAAAGTGKTYALRAAPDAWQEAGFRVLGAAVAAKAARELEAAAGIASYTLAKLTNELDTGRIHLTPHTVVVIDEAGMAGTRPPAPILQTAHDAGAKVVLVGDPHQLPEIEAGGMLNALTQLLDPITLSENRRQDDNWQGHALAHLRCGSVEAGLELFAEHDQIITADSATDVREAMLEDWWRARQAGEQVVMLAIRNSEVDLPQHPRTNPPRRRRHRPRTRTRR